MAEQTGRGGGEQSLPERLRASGYRSVHLGIFDTEGQLRERRFPIESLERFLGAGPTFVNVLHKWDIGEKVTGAGPFVGETIAADDASLRPHPFDDGSAMVIADFTGTSAALSPRRVLEKVLSRAHGAGYGVRASFEFEFIVLAETPESLRAKGFENLSLFAPDNRCWSAQSAAVHAELIAELEATLKKGEIGLTAIGMELGPGCLEATLASASGVAAADEAALFRSYSKAFFRKRGMTASFMAQLGAQFPGLSGHLHLSLVDRRTGANAFFERDAGDTMSPTFRHFVAGIAQLTPDLLPLCAHTVNAYRRLTPGNWAPKTASWAVENYAAAIRVVPAPQDVCRLEFRLPAADTNPHLTLAMVLAAGLWGIKTSAPLPAPLARGGPNETPTDAVPLPHDLLEAVRRLEASPVAKDLFGAPFVTHFCASRRHEEIELRRHVSAFERTRYLEMI